jgi:hypothetical protein
MSDATETVWWRGSDGTIHERVVTRAQAEALHRGEAVAFRIEREDVLVDARGTVTIRDYASGASTAD